MLQPEKIKVLADVSVVCFDKTGTLTGSVVRIHANTVACDFPVLTIELSYFLQTTLKQVKCIGLAAKEAFTPFLNLSVCNQSL